MAIHAFSDLNKRQQLAILIAVPCVIALGIIYLTYGSLGKLGADQGIPSILRRPDGLWAQIEAKTQEIEAKNVIIRRKKDVEDQLRGLAEDIREAEERLPKEAEKTEMRQMVERLAREIDIGTVTLNGVGIKDSQSPTNRGATGYQTLTIVADLEGNLNGIIRYIDLIEKNQRFMSLKSISIKPGSFKANPTSGKVDYGQHSVNLEIVTYYYPAGESPKKKGP